VYTASEVKLPGLDFSRFDNVLPHKGGCFRMSKFLDTYGNNIAVIVAVLGFLFFLIVEWPRISEVMRKLLKSLNKMPLFLFKIVAIAASGAVAGSLYMMLTTLLLDGYLNIDTVAHQIGFDWGRSC
jgi:hypothetical protein